MNQFIAIILVFVALGMHFTFCEWDFPDELSQISQAQYERTIYFSGSSGHRRRTAFSDNVFLLAKPESNREEAQLWGVILPFGIVGGGLFIAHAWKKHAPPTI